LQQTGEIRCARNASAARAEETPSTSGQDRPTSPVVDKAKDAFVVDTAAPLSPTGTNMKAVFG
jgi:hypothetical protein